MISASDREKVAARLVAKIQREDHGGEGPCWVWQAYCHSREGYGQLWFNGRIWAAHRLSYLVFTDDLPPLLDHQCNVRQCINPGHLKPSTDCENILRGTAPTAQNARKTHCKHGHRFDERNTRIDRDGRRKCRRCDAIRSRKRRTAA